MSMLTTLHDLSFIECNKNTITIRQTAISRALESFRIVRITQLLQKKSDHAFMLSRRTGTQHKKWLSRAVCCKNSRSGIGNAAPAVHNGQARLVAQIENDHPATSHDVERVLQAGIRERCRQRIEAFRAQELGMIGMGTRSPKDSHV